MDCRFVVTRDLNAIATFESPRNNNQSRTVKPNLVLSTNSCHDRESNPRPSPYRNRYTPYSMQNHSYLIHIYDCVIFP